MSQKKLICVIGGGSSGLASIKQCRDEDYDVICYERTDNFGGLWRYRDEDQEGVPSVAKSTIINTSKEFSTLSDFPPDKNDPNFMHNSKMVSKQFVIIT